MDLFGAVKRRSIFIAKSISHRLSPLALESRAFLPMRIEKGKANMLRPPFRVVMDFHGVRLVMEIHLFFSAFPFFIHLIHPRRCQPFDQTRYKLCDKINHKIDHTMFSPRHHKNPICRSALKNITKPVNRDASFQPAGSMLFPVGPVWIMRGSVFARPRI